MPFVMDLILIWQVVTFFLYSPKEKGKGQVCDLIKIILDSGETICCIVIVLDTVDYCLQ